MCKCEIGRNGECWEGSWRCPDVNLKRWGMWVGNWMCPGLKLSVVLKFGG